MKRVLALILSAVLLFSLSGCVKIYRQAWDGFCYTSYDEPVELDVTATNYILDLMNGGKWQSGNIKCPSDYYFSLQLGRVGYVSDEGYFNDFTLERSMKLTDEQREKVNEFLFNYNRVKIVGRVTEKYDGGCLIEITSDTEESVMAEAESRAVARRGGVGAAVGSTLGEPSGTGMGAALCSWGIKKPPIPKDRRQDVAFP